MFTSFKGKVREKLDSMLVNQSHLYLTDTDRDQIWDLYLQSYPEEQRQSFNCSACRSFIKNYGSVVAIVDNQLVSIWDIEIEEPYATVAKQLKEMVLSKAISNVFITQFSKLGVDKNRQLLDSGEIITWNHFYVEIPNRMVFNRTLSVEAQQAVFRDNKNVLYRSLNEITDNAVDTVLELIAQKSLYRGDEYLGLVKSFKTIKQEFSKLVDGQKDVYCWKMAVSGTASVLRIKNTAIGTLLTDVSEGKELDIAVSAFERIMAPSNYKRPNAIITKRMIEDAEKQINELGLSNSLQRRYATAEDITVNNVLFVDRPTKVTMGLLDALKGDVLINPRSFSKLEEVGIDSFLKDILPKADKIEVLVENKHSSRFVSLIAPVDLDSPSLFKWDNGFSWVYADELADGMKQRVKAAGGNVDGVLRFSIQWNEKGDSICDLDAHAYEPNKNHIYFGNYKGSKTTASGTLDVDMIRPRVIGVENITWSDLNKMPMGDYTLSINNYDGGHNTGFSAEVEFDGQIHEFHYNKKFTGTQKIAVVNLSKSGFTITPLLEGSTRVNSKKIWNLDTCQFHPVSMILKSPNYWDSKTVGNQHTFFMINKANNPDEARGFFNEFLKDEFTPHRRVFEALGSKMKVAKSESQLSGLGFSSTSQEELIVKVTGSFTRTLKIKF